MQASRLEFARALRGWRDSHTPKLSQAELAHSIGVSTQTISRWERGLNDVERDADAAWIQEHLGIEAPRPARTQAAKLGLEERLAGLELLLETFEQRVAATEALVARFAGVSVALPNPDETLNPGDLEVLSEAVAPRQRGSSRRRGRGPEHG